MLGASSAAAPARALLAGRTAIVTGGSSGIGLAIAARFVREGARCVVVGRHEGRLKTAVSQISSSSTSLGLVSSHAGDVAQKATWDELAKLCPDTSILVNAAGIAQRTLLVRLPTDDIDRLLMTNLRGTILGCQMAASAMLKSKTKDRPSGCIINISSVLATKGGRGATVYAASKAGILGLTRSLAVELGKTGTRVNTLVPGYIDTAMTTDVAESEISKIPLGRMGLPDEVADAAVFLASNEYVNNCVLNVDGGLSAI